MSFLPAWNSVGTHVHTTTPPPPTHTQCRSSTSRKTLLCSAGPICLFWCLLACSQCIYANTHTHTHRELRFSAWLLALLERTVAYMFRSACLPTLTRTQTNTHTSSTQGWGPYVYSIAVERKGSKGGVEGTRIHAAGRKMQLVPQAPPSKLLYRIGPVKVFARMCVLVSADLTGTHGGAGPFMIPKVSLLSLNCKHARSTRCNARMPHTTRN